MRIELSLDASTLLFRMLCAPRSLASSPDERVNEYNAKDTIAQTDCANIHRWMTTKVATPRDDGSGAYKMNAYNGKIKEKYVARLKEIAKHYENIGRNVTNCRAYEELLLALDGKPMVIDAVEEDGEEAPPEKK